MDVTTNRNAVPKTNGQSAAGLNMPGGGKAKRRPSLLGQ